MTGRTHDAILIVIGLLYPLVTCGLVAGHRYGPLGFERACFGLLAPGATVAAVLTAKAFGARFRVAPLMAFVGWIGLVTLAHVWLLDAASALV